MEFLRCSFVIVSAVGLTLGCGKKTAQVQVTYASMNGNDNGCAVAEAVNPDGNSNGEIYYIASDSDPSVFEQLRLAQTNCKKTWVLELDVSESEEGMGAACTLGSALHGKVKPVKVEKVLASRTIDRDHCISVSSSDVTDGSLGSQVE